MIRLSNAGRQKSAIQSFAYKVWTGIHRNAEDAELDPEPVAKLPPILPLEERTSYS